MHRLIWNKSVHGKYNLISVWFDKILKIFLCVRSEISDMFKLAIAILENVRVPTEVFNMDAPSLLKYLAELC